MRRTVRADAAYLPLPLSDAGRCACGAADWVAVAPGTAADATVSPDPKVTPLRPGAAVASVFWCAPCWTEAFTKPKTEKRLDNA